MSYKNFAQKSSEVIRVLIPLLVVFGLYFLIPNNLNFKYEFDRGKVWNYEDLTAPFEFGIKKSPELLKTQEEETIANSPILYKDVELEEEVRSALIEELNVQTEILKDSDLAMDFKSKKNIYQSEGLKILKLIYDKGLISAKDLAMNNETAVINVISESSISKVPNQNIFVLDELGPKLQEFLTQSGLVDYQILYKSIKSVLKPNYKYNLEATQKYQKDRLNNITRYDGVVNNGDLIIQKGTIVTDELFYKLDSFKDQYEVNQENDGSVFELTAGYIILLLSLIGIYFLFIFKNVKEVYESNKNLIFSFFWILAYSYLVYFIVIKAKINIYVIPFAIIPIVMKSFFSERLALFTFTITILFSALITSMGFEFVFVQLMAGTVAALSVRQTRYWSKFFITIFYVFLTYAVLLFAFDLINVGSVFKVDYTKYSYLVVNLILLSLSYPMIPLFDKLFGYVSEISLAELSDVNLPLLRDLSMKAPGTFQHSLQVANISESVANAIGADGMLLKVAALYHDIGKMKNPGYFIENQGGSNPHKDITPIESAKIITGHITDGIKMAEKNGLPKSIVDLIKTHHGTTFVQYFLHQQRELKPEGDFDETLFQYPGPKPTTKEQTILMIVDSIEAASKSLKEPTEENLTNLLNNIIEHKIRSGQFEHAHLTFEELEIAKKIIIDMLKSIFHIRIEYPKDKEA